MTSLMRNSEADDWFRTIIMWTFAGLAAVLAGVGIFGVTARSGGTEGEGDGDPIGPGSAELVPGGAGAP